MPNSTAIQVERLQSDSLWGAAAIAQYLGCSEKKVYELCRRGELPAGKIGGSLFTTRARLDRFMQDVTEPSAAD